MKNKLKQIKSAALQHFARAYLAALIFSAVIITAALVAVAKNSITSMEIDAMRSAAGLMASDMQQQCEVMSGVHERILLNNQFTPSVLKKDKYNEIEMLELLSNYANYSPISDSFYLMYENDNMIYLSSRKKALFRFHVLENYSLNNEQTGKLRQELFANREIRLLNLSERGGKDVVLFVLPVTFAKNTSGEGAVLVFEVDAVTLEKRLDSVMGYHFDHFAIYRKGEKCFQVGDMDAIPADFIADRGESRYIHLNANRYLLSATSKDGSFTVYAQTEDHAFGRTVYAHGDKIVLFVILLTIVFVLFALGAALRSSRPIRRLAQRYGDPQKDDEYDEFYILENAIQSIESNRKASVRNAREQFLQLILQGNCNEHMLKQWAQLGVSFEFENNCVFLIDTDEADQGLIEEIEGFGDSHMRIYALRPAGRDYITVCCSFAHDSTGSELYDNLCSLMDEKSVFMGNCYDTPLKMPLSYHEAKQAWKTENNYSQQLGLIYTEVNRRLETVKLAIKSSRVDIVEAEIGKLSELLSTSDDAVLLQKYIYHSLLSCVVSSLQEERRNDMTRTMESLMVSDFKLFAAELFKMLRENQMEISEENVSVVHDILRYIEKNAGNCDLCLDMLVEEFMLNADYISQLIKNQTGVAFKEYLIRLRMQIAQKLLLENQELTINEVANRAGYRTTSNFIKRFRETAGMTPLEFRKSRLIPGP